MAVKSLHKKCWDISDLGILWILCIVREAHLEHALHALFLGGSGGMSPQENFEK